MTEFNQNSPQYINEGYKIWKKNTTFLYNMLQTYELSSCSQTLDWFSQSYTTNNWSVRSLLLGTNSLIKNYLMIANIYLPTKDSLTNYTSYIEQKPEGTHDDMGYVGTMGQQDLAIQTELPQNGEVMKAKVNQLQPNIIAVKIGGVNAQLIIYDLNNQPAEIEGTKVVLEGHQCEGFGLSWHPTHKNWLLSGSYDKNCFVWDTQKPHQPFFHGRSTQGIEDVQWSHADTTVFACASQDKTITMWDTRQSEAKPFLSKQAHNGEVYSLDFNSKAKHLLLSGGEDGNVMLWDTRNMSTRLNTFYGHNDLVSRVAWCPNNPLVFASGSQDRRVVVWNMAAIKSEQNKNSNEIQFIHGGHRSRVCDVSWLPDTYTLASCEENNVMHVWMMNQTLLPQM